MLERLSLETFEPLCGATFEILTDDGSLQAVLSEIRPLGQQEPDQRRQFSLVFEVTGGSRHEQRIYLLTHPGLGSLELFLVPIGPRGGAMRYEAVFT